MSIAVTTTDPTNTGVSTTSSSSLTGSNAADLQSSFLTLLVAQLKNQDPVSYTHLLRHAGHFPSREIKDEHFLFCIAAKTFPITSGTIFFYQNVALIDVYKRQVLSWPGRVSIIKSSSGELS